MLAKLTIKQRRFIDEYLVDLNATQAAIRAGYRANRAYAMGHENLKKPEIARAIQSAMVERAQKTGITQTRVVEELAKIAFGDLRGSLTWGPQGVTLVDSALLGEDQAAAISEVSETTTKDGGSLKIKRHDKVRALELLGRHLGMFTDKVETKIDGGLVVTWKK